MMSECGEHPLPTLSFEDQQQRPSAVTVLPAPNREVRQEIVSLEAEIKAFLKAEGIAEPDCPLTHHFAPGAYGREILLPKGVLVIGKIHKHAHLNLVMKGKVTVGTEEGVRHIEGPLVFVSKPGTKRVVYAHEDTIWVTVHLTDSRDLDEIEEQIIAKTYEDYDALQGIDTKHLLEVMAQKEAV